MSQAPGATSGGSPSRERRRREPGAENEQAQAPLVHPREGQETGEGGFKRGQPDTPSDPTASEPRWKKARKAADDTDDSPGYDLKVLADLIKAGDIEAVGAALTEDAGWVNFEMPESVNGEMQSLTPLCIAAMHGHTELGRQLVAHGASLDPPSAHSNPLVMAAGRGHLEFVRMLLDEGAEVDWTDDDGNGALLAAVQAKHTKVVELLLAREANPNQWFSSSGDTALTAAISHGDSPTACALLSMGADVRIPGRLGVLPLALAAGYPELIRRLFQAGAQFTDQGSGEQAISAAIEKGCVQSLQLLFDAWKPGPDDARKAELLAGAVQSNQAEVVSWMLENGTPVDGRHGELTAFHYAVTGGNLDLAKLLLAHGADPLARTGTVNGTALHLAACRGSVEIAEFLLEHGADVHATDAGGFTPLHCASSLPMLRLLHEKGGDLHARGLKGQTCLMLAADQADRDACAWLLDQGLPMDALDQDGKTALSYVCRDDMLDSERLGATVVELLARGANPNLADRKGMTPLMLAAGRGELEIVGSLLCNGADVHALDHNKSTALFKAAEIVSVEVARKLMDFGACADLTNAHGKTPLSVASESGNTDLVLFLLNGGLTVSAKQRGRECEIAMHAAAQLPDPGLLQRLHAAGADLSVRNKKDKSPLILAARAGNLETVRYLLQQGVDADQLDDEQWSALHHACFMGHLELAKLLLEHGASPERQDVSKETPLMLAAKNGQLNLVNMLLERKVNVQAVNNNLNESALHLACRGGYLEIARALIEQGGDPSVPNANDRTAAMEAAAQGNLELVQLLWQVLEKRDDAASHAVQLLHCAAHQSSRDIIRWLLDEQLAAVNARGKSQETALHWACNGNSYKAVRLLIDRGADLSAQDHGGDTPLMLAAHNNHVAAFESLLDIGADIHQRNHAGRNALDVALKANAVPIVERLIKEGATPTVAANSGEPDSYEISPLCFDLFTRRALLMSPPQTFEAPRLEQPLVWLMKLARILTTSGRQEVARRIVTDGKFMNMTTRLILLNLKSFEKEASVQAAAPTETPANLPAIGILKAAQWEQILSWTLAQLSTSADGMDGMGDLTPNTQNILTGLHTTHVKALNAIGLAGVDAYSKKLDAQLKPRLHESVNVMGRFVSDELRKTVIKELVLLEPVAELLLRFVEEVNQQVRASAPGIPYTRRFKEGIEGQIGPWSERQAISRTFFLRYGNHDVANFLFDQWRAVCAALGMQIPESAPLGPPEKAQEDDNSSSDSD